MDNYSKIILTVIAISLITINVKLWHPDLQPQRPPIVSDFVKLNNISDHSQRKEARDKLLNRLPMSKIYGTTTVTGTVDVDDVSDTIIVSGTVDVGDVSGTVNVREW